MICEYVLGYQMYASVFIMRLIWWAERVTETMMYCRKTMSSKTTNW